MVSNKSGEAEKTAYPFIPDKLKVHTHKSVDALKKHPKMAQPPYTLYLKYPLPLRDTTVIVALFHNRQLIIWANHDPLGLQGRLS